MAGARDAGAVLLLLLRFSFFMRRRWLQIPFSSRPLWLLAIMHYRNANEMGDEMDATLNVRMEEVVKRRGDKVLKDNGVSVSAAVRALWEEMGTTRELPDFIRKRQECDDQTQAKKNMLSALVGVAQGSLSNMTDEELRAVGMERYE